MGVTQGKTQKSQFKFQRNTRYGSDKKEYRDDTIHNEENNKRKDINRKTSYTKKRREKHIYKRNTLSIFKYKSINEDSTKVNKIPKTEKETYSKILEEEVLSKEELNGKNDDNKVFNKMSKLNDSEELVNESSIEPIKDLIPTIEDDYMDNINEYLPFDINTEIKMSPKETPKKINFQTKTTSHKIENLNILSNFKPRQILTPMTAYSSTSPFIINKKESHYINEDYNVIRKTDDEYKQYNKGIEDRRRYSTLTREVKSLQMTPKNAELKQSNIISSPNEAVIKSIINNGSISPMKSSKNISSKFQSRSSKFLVKNSKPPH